MIMPDKARTWPSPWVQATLFLALLAGAAFQVMAPAWDSRQRATQLYQDSWFVGGRGGNLEARHREAAVARVEAALELAPGNPLYEQALVWHSPPERLQALLKERRLGPGARTLAAGLLFQQATAYRRADAADLVAALDTLIAADPTNALPRYLNAHLLARMGRFGDALAEVQAGNRLPTMRHYLPAVGRSVRDSAASPMLTANLSPVHLALRNLARLLWDEAHVRLRQRKADEARAILEACCRMGVQAAGAEPRASVPFLVGEAVFSIGWSGLDPLLKDFGPKQKLETYEAMGGALERVQRDVREGFDASSRGVARYATALLAPLFLRYAGMLAAILLLGALLCRTAAARAARRSEETPVTVAPWGPGWLARVCLALYGFGALCLLALAAALRAAPDTAAVGLYSTLAVPLCGLPLLFLLAALSSIRRGYGRHTGVYVPLSRVLPRRHPAVSAWAWRHLSTALAYQALFLIACLCLATCLYKPLIGGHPWQVERFAVGTLSQEEALVTRGLTGIRAAAGAAGTPSR